MLKTIYITVCLLPVLSCAAFAQAPTDTPVTPTPVVTPDSAAASTSSAPTPAPVPAVVVPPPDKTYLNKAFIFPAEIVQKAVKKGQDAAKKGDQLLDLLAPTGQMPRGVRGEKGRSHESAVYFENQNGMYFAQQAYSAAINYEPLDIPDRVLKKGAYIGGITFLVILQSVPQVKTDIFSRDREAGEDDVKVTKFVLTDDLGHIIQSDSTNATDIEQGTQHFTGVVTVPHTETEHTKATATIDSTATASGQATTTYHYNEYIPWSEDHPYYSAQYEVSFPLFDAKGQPLITMQAKSMTLHIITPNGEKVVDYKLEAPHL